MLVKGNLFLMLGKKVLSLLFCAAAKAYGSGRAVVVAGQTAGTVAMPFYIGRYL